MQAITYAAYGGPEQLRLDDIPIPEPGPGKVRVRVKCASANPFDSHFLHGEPLFMRLFIGLRRPKLGRLGRDMAGIVEALGRGVSEFAVGDEVHGAAEGAFAEQAIANVVDLANKPAAMSWDDAAALPMVALTGWQGLQAGACKPGDRVLVTGASGGIGHLVVQMAKAQGCHVTAVCKTSNIHWVKELGADAVIDYKTTDLFAVADAFDVIVDPVSSGSVADFTRITKRGGTYVWLGSATMGRTWGPLGRIVRMRLGPKHGRNLRSVDAKRRRADLDTINKMHQAGKLRVVIEQTLPLADTAKAVAHMRAGHTKGKTVIRVS